MRIVQPRHDECAGQIPYLGLRPGESLDLCIRADSQHLAVAEGHGGDDLRIAFLQACACQNRAVDENQVGSLCRKRNGQKRRRDSQ